MESVDKGNKSRSSEEETVEDSGSLNIPKEVLQKAQEECEALHANMSEPDFATDPYCPRLFDGWSCWNDTPAGEVAYVDCPDFVPGFDAKRKGLKVCLENGTWFKHPNTNEHWSNYTNCIDYPNMEMHQSVNRVYIAGYGTSLIALGISLFIFMYFRSLQCKRVLIHKNLFSSFLLNNTLWLTWHLFVTEKSDVISSNGVGCQMLHVFLHYFLVSNYMWMFCEGLYLHTLLAVAFVAENRILKWFYLLGWGLPALLTLVYGIARGCDSKASQYCWIDDTNYNYILNVPVILSLLVNLFFLINIVRVLVTKLRAANTAPDNHSTRKAVRATLILIPLLGLHYILTPFTPPPGSKLRTVYLIASAVVSSFQGLAVSLLFCFFNGEVLAIFKKKWNQHKLMRAPQSYNATSVSYMKTSIADGVTFTTNCDGQNSAEDV
ncbi:UNVERIFIED_CONTAM: hypothetical protein RMT77_012148 [Armadillidium vulgare]